MESELSQIKLLLWIILGLQLLFVLLNIACRVFGCGQARDADYRDLMDRGELDALLASTGKRLKSHPHDADALYFHARVLHASGLPQSARPYVERLAMLDPLMAKAAAEWIGLLEAEVTQAAANEARGEEPVKNPGQTTAPSP